MPRCRAGTAPGRYARAVVGEERSIHNPVTGERFVSMVRGSDTNGDYVEGRGFLPVGTRPPGVHRHAHQDESVTVVTGRIRARVGDEENEYGPGETLFLPKRHLARLLGRRRRARGDDRPG